MQVDCDMVCVMGREKNRDYSELDDEFAGEIVNYELSDDPDHEYEMDFNGGQSSTAFVHFELHNTADGKRLMSFLNDARNTYERLQMLGFDKEAKEHLRQCEKGCDFLFIDCSSEAGIPDCVCLRKTQNVPWEEPEEERKSREELKKRRIETLLLNPTCHLIYEPVFQFGDTITFESKRQNLCGSCNLREENSVEYAARLTQLSFPHFVSKAALYMARFINRCRRALSGGAPYTLGEAYMFMEHGKCMHDAYLGSEVSQAMRNVGLSGTVATTFMNELEEIRKIRLERQGETSSSPSYGRKELNRLLKSDPNGQLRDQRVKREKRKRRKKKTSHHPVEEGDHN